MDHAEWTRPVAIALLFLAQALVIDSGCTRDRVQASIYEGLQARECIVREGESYPRMGVDCRKQSYSDYSTDRERSRAQRNAAQGP